MPAPVIHDVSLNFGESDTAEFELTAVASGQATIMVQVAYYEWEFPAMSSSNPLILTVAP
jgi:hypothetical protein